MNRGLGSFLLVCLSACRTPEDGGLDAAKESLLAGDLLHTIVLLDQVTPVDPDFPEARALANAVERRMRTGHTLLSKGMSMRAEWRDEDALRYFELAREVWPKVPGAREMARATRHRMRSSEVVASGGGASGSEAGSSALTRPVATGPVTAPVVEPVDTDPPAAPAGEVALPAQDGTGPESPAAATEPVRSSGSRTPAASDPSTRERLRAAETLLGRGDLERALELIEALHAESPGDRNVRRTLLRILHQRALLYYGQGNLQLAILDWSNVLRLDPEHRQARAFTAAAETELHALRAPGSQ